MPDENNPPNSDAGSSRFSRKSSILATFTCGLETRAGASGMMNGTTNGSIFGVCASCFKPSCENFTHGIRSVYLLSGVRNMMPLSSNLTTSPVTVVPSTSEYGPAATAASSPQSQKPAIVQRSLCTWGF